MAVAVRPMLVRHRIRNRLIERNSKYVPPMFTALAVPQRSVSLSNIATSTRTRAAQQSFRTRAAQQSSSMATEWSTSIITLPAYSRGCHVITRRLLEEIQPTLQTMEAGLCNLFIQHTSASLTINENASSDVPLDLNDALDKLAPDGNVVKYRHDDEGPDDMPAHIKSSLMGPSLTVPIAHGRLALGTWQGIYLNEHRDYGGPRRIVVTIQGQKRADGKSYGKYG